MASTALVVGGLALAGGLAYVLWKRSQAAQPSTCDKLCTAAGDPEGHTACVTACNLAGGVLSLVSAANPFSDQAAELSGQQSKRQANNDSLNGAVDIKAPWPVTAATTLASPSLRYKNGCEPFFGAPGWGKCKPGTLDMYRSAVDQGASGNFGFDEASLVTEAPSVSVAARTATMTNYTNVGDPKNASNIAGVPGGVTVHTVPIVKGAFLTGGPGDPTTIGPYGPNDAGAYWYVRGQKVTACGKAVAPKAVVMQQYHPDQIAALTDGDADTCVPIGQDPTVVQTSIGCVGQSAPAGYTWDESSGGFWRRLKVGESPNAGPCASNAPGTTPVSTAARISGTLTL